MQVREIEIERRNQRGGNYCCSCCCIDMCAYTNWDCSFICHYIGLIFLTLISPVLFVFFPIALLVFSVLIEITFCRVWVIPITNPFFSVWYLKQRRDDDDD